VNQRAERPRAPSWKRQVHRENCVILLYTDDICFILHCFISKSSGSPEPRAPHQVHRENFVLLLYIDSTYDLLCIVGLAPPDCLGLTRYIGIDHNFVLTRAEHGVNQFGLTLTAPGTPRHRGLTRQSWLWLTQADVFAFARHSFTLRLLCTNQSSFSCPLSPALPTRLQYDCTSIAQ